MVLASQLGEREAKPETTVQDSVPTFVSMKPVDTFNKTSGYFSALLVAKHDLLLTSTK